jgi:hypothetical protein
MPRKLEPRTAVFKCRGPGHHIFRRRAPHWVHSTPGSNEPGPAAMANIPEVRCPECNSLSDLVKDNVAP